MLFLVSLHVEYVELLESKMPNQFSITRQNILVVAFFILLAGLLSLLFSLLEPFLRAFVWSTILVMVFYPVYSFLLKRTGGRSTLAALISTLLVVLFLALPGFFMVINLGRELPKAYAFLSTTQWTEKSQWLMDKLRTLNIGSWLQNWGFDSNQSDALLQDKIATTLQTLSQEVLKRVSFIIENLAGFVLEAVFICVAVFFFFRDGSRLAFKAIEFLPMEKEHQKKVTHTFSVTVTAVVRAIFITALTEGVLSTLGFVAGGVPVPVLLGLAVFILSFIPFLGVTWVWVPVAAWLFYQDHTVAAVGITLWGIVLSGIDHVMRPWLIGSEAKLPLFWLFFTTIGGLKVYGFLGIFLGPIILSMGMAFLSIYREVYLNLRKPTHSRRTS
jgi:predicted PurR-regulated permease PerM